MLTTGFIVFLGVALLLAKLPRRLMLRALRHDLAIDIIVSVLVFVPSRWARSCSGRASSTRRKRLSASRSHACATTAGRSMG